MTKTQKSIYYVLMVLATALFLFSAYLKLTGDQMQIQGFTQAHLPIWFMYFIGIAELLGAIGLWIPKLQKWAIWGLMIIMVGAVVTTAIFQSVGLALIPLVVGIVLYFIMKLGKKRGMSAPSAPSNPAPTATA